MIDIEKLQNHYFKLEDIAVTPNDDVHINQFLIRTIFIKDLPKDRLMILVNSLFNRGILVHNRKPYSYRPEHCILQMSNLKISTLSECSTYLERYLVILIDLYMTSQLPVNDVKMRWVINTLIEYDVIENVNDPMNKKAESFKDLFEIA